LTLKPHSMNSARTRPGGRAPLLREIRYAFRDSKRALWLPACAHDGGFRLHGPPLCRPGALRGRPPFASRSYLDVKLGWRITFWRAGDRMVMATRWKGAISSSTSGSRPAWPAVMPRPQGAGLNLQSDGAIDGGRDIPHQIVAQKSSVFLAPGSPPLLQRSCLGRRPAVHRRVRPSGVFRRRPGGPVDAPIASPGFRLHPYLNTDPLRIVLN